MADVIFTLFGGSRDPGFFDFIAAYAMTGNVEPHDVIRKAIAEGDITYPGKVIVHVCDEEEDSWLTTWEVFETSDGLDVIGWLPDTVSKTQDVTRWPPRR
jgi:hypothetical protein